jgi:hypothetical protein
MEVLTDEKLMDNYAKVIKSPKRPLFGNGMSVSSVTVHSEKIFHMYAHTVKMVQPSPVLPTVHGC